MIEDRQWYPFWAGVACCQSFWMLDLVGAALVSCAVIFVAFDRKGDATRIT